MTLNPLLSLILLYYFSTVFSFDSDYRIAFVFAGSSRSLILPSVHLTIKKNLIDSGCPFPRCIADIFARVSTTDNVLAGMDSAGHLRSSGVHNVTSEIVQALTQLSERGQIVIDWCDIGSTKETSYLDKFKGLRHKVFRIMDKRRYSMYGNRAAAYDLARDHEKWANVVYRYVVHVRLDCAWFEKVPPIDSWFRSPSGNTIFSGVWAPDRWFFPPPDTFAVMSREYADEYFSLDNLVAKGVMCLGGPNVDSGPYSDPVLLRLGFLKSEFDEVRGAPCHVDPSIKYINSFVNGKGITVHFSGFSEAIYGRKLNHFGVSFQSGTLKYRALPMAIVRYDGSVSGMRLVCGFLLRGGIIDFLRHSQAFPLTLASACSFLEQLQNDRNVACSRQLMRQSASSSVTLTSSKADMQQCIQSQHQALNCIREMNFMPFSIHIARTNTSHSALDASYCLTVQGHHISVEKCVKRFYDPKRDMHMLFAENQTFHFDPMLTDPQPLRHINQDMDMSCLTRMQNSHFNANQFQFRSCDNNWDTDPSHPQLFRVLVMEVTQSKRADLMTAYRDVFDVATALESVAMKDPTLHRIHLAFGDVSTQKAIGRGAIYPQDKCLQYSPVVPLEHTAISFVRGPCYTGKSNSRPSTTFIARRHTSFVDYLLDN